MENGVKSICPFCSMGCSLELRPTSGAPYIGAEQLAALEHDRDGRHNRGSLCGRGNMSLELIMTPARIDAPQLRVDGEQVPADWDAALEQVVTRLTGALAGSGSNAAGVLVGPWLTDDEVAGAVRLARLLGTPHLDLFEPIDSAVLTGARRSGARPERIDSVEQIEAMRALLVVGDVFTHAPCLARPTLDARYDRRDNVMTTLGSWNSRTSLFGKPRLRCAPGREAAVLTLMLRLVLDGLDDQGPPWAEEARAALASLEPDELEGLGGVTAEQLQWPVESLLRETGSGVLFAGGFAETERLDLVAGLCALIAEATASRLLVMHTGANTAGVRRALDDAGFPGSYGYSAPEMIEAAGTGDLDALLVLGADPLGGSPGGLAEEAVAGLACLVTTAPLPSETARVAHVVLPSAVWGEVAGCVEDAFGQRRELSPCLPPPAAAWGHARILAELCERLSERPPAPAPAGAAPLRGGIEERFFGELELHFRLARRRGAALETGTHDLFPEYDPSHSADGWWTGPLSWPRHELPRPRVALSPEHARELGVTEGERVRVRSREASALLSVRIERRLAEGMVLASPHFPEVRRLTAWSLDPALRQLDVRPGRVSVERPEEPTA